MKEQKKTEESGITLIALVVTIIVLLLLAGISVQMLTGNNGVLTRAGEAKENTEVEQIIEEARLDILDKMTIKKSNKITELELREILEPKYGTVSTGHNSINDETLTSKDGKYIIQVSKIYNVDISVKIKDLNGQIQEVTKDDLATYYGKKVDYDENGAIYRIFYIDFDGKYGEPGTIYLKGEGNGDSVGGYYINSYSTYIFTYTEDNLIKKMNPQWANDINGGKKEFNTWLKGEKESAALCEPTKNKLEGDWKRFFNNEKANYALGAPSLEMFCDSYNQVPHQTGISTLEAIYNSASQGYELKIDNSSENINYLRESLIDSSYNNMYCSGGFLASPSAYWGGYLVCEYWGGTFYAREYEWGASGSPLISLKKGFIPQIQVE